MKYQRRRRLRIVNRSAARLPAVSPPIPSTYSTSFLASIVDSVDAAIVGVSLNDSTIVNWNRGAELMYGYTAAEVLGSDIRLIVPPTHQHEIDLMLRAVKQGEQVSHHQSVRVGKDGTLLNVSVNISPVRDESGTLVGIASIAHDMTDRIRAGQQMEFMVQVLDQVRAAIVAVDIKGHITLWNSYAGQLFGWKGKEVTGQPITDLIVGPREQSRGPDIMAVIASAGSWEGEITLGRRDGTAFPAYVVGTLIHGPEGTRLGVAGIIMNISERKMYEAKLEHHAAVEASLVQQLSIAREAERRRLARDIHDGPLQSIAASLVTADRALVRLQRRQEEGAEEEIRTLREELEQAVGELRDVLSDLSLEVLSNVGLQEALHSQTARFSRATGIHVQMSTMLRGNLPSSFELLIYRLVQEALANVRKHSHASNAWVELESQHGKLTLAISDNGRGFDLEHAPGEHEDGHKMGLNSMRERIQSVGGEMTVLTQRGEGTTLRFWCPIPEESEELMEAVS